MNNVILIGILIFLGIYLFMLAIWWLVCAIGSKNALKSGKRGHFDFVEMLSMLISKFWRCVEYLGLVAVVACGIMFGFWWVIIPVLLEFGRMYFFPSLFYYPFRWVMRPYFGKVSIKYAVDKHVERRNDIARQKEEAAKRGWKW